MGRDLRLTERALADLARVYLWYSQEGSGEAATRRLRRVLAALDTIAETPYLGRSGTRPGYRELLREGHRILYRVIPDDLANTTGGTVIVQRIFGPGQVR